ncbi:F-box/LRR-repeat protein 12 [Gouania willdenowi]|uniref:F-box domain-containing protein n=1 Tax=Gouania willdenowi TaxID=441366 RepID=A0A8C5HDS5_GOUWI|nr:F-box/LRR-repeat protein 12 [Gouania willdenowi]
MDESEYNHVENLPENIMIELLSYLSVIELIRAQRVCKRWKRLAKDQMLWRNVNLTSCKRVSVRFLWFLLRRCLGPGLRSLRLRGFLLSARKGTLLSESWLKALCAKCPRLSKLHLLHVDLRSLVTIRVLPQTLQELELRECELPPDFFSQAAEAGSHQGEHGSRSYIIIERLVVNTVPSFTDHHLQSLTSWEKLSRLELRDTFRVTVKGLRDCAAKTGINGVEGLSHLKFLEIGSLGRQVQMASLALGVGWPGLEELSLGGKEVGPGLLTTNRLKDLKRLRLWACRLSEHQVVRSCRTLRGLRQMEFVDVVFLSPWGPVGAEREGGEEEEAADSDGSGDENKKRDAIICSVRHILGELLPSCTLAFTNCSAQINTD